jgi:DNA-binding transcriptional regulator YbjK
MVWRGNVNEISQMIANAVTTAVKNETAPLQVTISQLKESTTATTARMETMMANYATRADVSQLRSEMQAMGTAFMPKALSDQRYDELTRRLKDRDDDVERRFKDIDQRLNDQNSRGFSVGMNSVVWVIGGLGLLMTLISTVITIIVLAHK